MRLKRTLMMAVLALASVVLCAGSAASEGYLERVGRLKRTVTDLSRFGSRVVGYPGADSAAVYLKARLRAAGVAEILEHTFEEPVPVDEGFELEAGGETIRLYGVWPNLVRTPTVPVSGLDAPLVYGGDASMPALAGKPVEGHIVLVEYASGFNWVNVFNLGARGVIFLGETRAHRKDGAQKFLDVPADLPRFYAPAASAKRLRDLAEREAPVRVTGRMSWQRVQGTNLIGILPGSDPALRGEAIYLSAYYDAMSPVPAIAPGAEQASGVAALLETVEELAARKPARSVIVVLMSGHFLNVAGARQFAPLVQMAAGIRDEFPGRPPTPEETRIVERLDDFTLRTFLGYDLTTSSETLTAAKPGFPYRTKVKSPSIADRFVAFVEAYEDSAIAGRLLVGHSLKTDYTRTGLGAIKESVPTDAAVLALGGAPSISFVTLNDTRPWFDSPTDRVAGMRFENLARQADFLTYVVARLVDMRDMPAWDWEGDVFATLRGEVVHYGARSYLPDRPTVDAVVRVRRRNPTLAGVRGDFWAMADSAGSWVVQGLETTKILYTKKVRIEAYGMDPETGAVTDVPDWGVNGERHLPDRALKILVDDAVEHVQVVTARLQGLTLFETFDPRNLLTPERLEVIDATTEAEPPQFGGVLPLTRQEVDLFDYPNRVKSWVQPTAVVYGAPRTRLKVVMSTGEYGLGRRLLLLNSDDDHRDGTGYAVGESAVLPLTAFRVAQDFTLLNRQRIDNLERHGVFNRRLAEFQKRSEDLLAEARAARQSKDYGTFLDRARLAWAYAAAAYSDVSSTQSGVIQGALFLLAVIVPFAHFAERIVFGFKDLRNQVFGFFGFFIAGFVALRYLHPAFELSISPAVILLGFVIMVLSLLVTSIGISRLNHEMRELAAGRRGRERGDLQRRGTWGTSIGVGLAHLRRRPLRTGLTCGTLVLLTFSVLSFTSIRSTLRTNKIDIGGDARYEGVLVRMPGWQIMEMSAYYAMVDRFGPDRVAPRAWFGVENLTESYPIYRADVPVGSLPPVQAIAVVGMTSQESRVLRPQDGLIAGRWLLPGERDAALLPAPFADSLRIGPADLEKARIDLFGESFRVVGILEKDAMEVRDLNNESALPLDAESREFAKVRVGTSMGSQLPNFPHLPAERTIVLPFDRVMRWEKANLASVAILADDDFASDLQVMAETMDINLFAGVGGRRYLMNTVGIASVSGVADLAVPIGIAALIVLNTMLGAVYERTREIGTFNAVGLAPGHVSGLFMAEAAAYAVVGGVMGYLLGQTVAQTLGSTGLLQGLELNYSSMSAVLSLGLVMMVVMGSALYPAHVAGKICTPGIERKWQAPKPEGDRLRMFLPFTLVPRDAIGMGAFLREFWASRQEQSIGAGFYVESLDVRREGDTLTLTATTWLAPFDQGVMQDVAVSMFPDPETGYYQIQVTLQRTAGDVATWTRVNRTFLDDVRKQFLIWRTLSQEDRNSYIEELEQFTSAATA